MYSTLGFLIALALTGPTFSGTDLVQAAKSQIGVTTSYDSRYTKIKFPNGDVPLDRGVCTDVVIRAYRKFGVDLQKLVYEDMRQHWSAYPNPWHLKGTDTNIDHRRVPNLITFFSRNGSTLPITKDPKGFAPGDIVTWRLFNGAPHIGIISSEKSNAGIPIVIHNIGQGVRQEDILFSCTITGHFRFYPHA